MVRDGAEGEPFEQIYQVGFSPDSRHLGYWGKQDGAWFLVVDGVKSGIGKPATFGRHAYSLLWINSKLIRTIIYRGDDIVLVDATLLE